MSIIVEAQLTELQIRSDIEFLKYQVKRCGVTMTKGTGISLLMDKCEEYLSSKDVFKDTLSAVLSLTTLVGSLKTLWFDGVEFKQQLSAMNTGSYAYGSPSVGGDRNYKDFEFEIFSAAFMRRMGVQALLPQESAGNDIIVGATEVQCKHPDVFNRNQIERYLRAFVSKLNQNNTYGIFGIATEDCFLAENWDPEEEKRKQKEYDAILDEVFSEVLPSRTRVLGVYTTLTRFFYKDGFQLRRDTNSAFCFRPDRPEIKDHHYREAYKILGCFNPSPYWMTFGQKKNGTAESETAS